MGITVNIPVGHKFRDGGHAFTCSLTPAGTAPVYAVNSLSSQAPSAGSAMVSARMVRRSTDTVLSPWAAAIACSDDAPSAVTHFTVPGAGGRNCPAHDILATSMSAFPAARVTFVPGI